MKLFDSKPELFLAALATAVCCLAGCASHSAVDQNAFVKNALAATDSSAMKTLRHNSDEEKAAIARYETFNSDLSESNVVNNTKNVYSADLYFCDPFKVVRGEPEYEACLLRALGGVEQFSVEWKDVAVSQSDYYFRWVMSMKLKSDPKGAPPSQTLGISEVRFGPDGKVIFQQDYYDAAAFLYEKIAILGSEIRFVKNHLQPKPPPAGN